jgi:hypothetical protein
MNRSKPAILKRVLFIMMMYCLSAAFINVLYGESLDENTDLLEYREAELSIKSSFSSRPKQVEIQAFSFLDNIPLLKWKMMKGYELSLYVELEDEYFATVHFVIKDDEKGKKVRLKGNLDKISGRIYLYLR